MKIVNRGSEIPIIKRAVRRIATKWCGLGRRGITLFRMQSMPGYLSRLSSSGGKRSQTAKEHASMAWRGVAWHGMVRWKHRTSSEHIELRLVLPKGIYYLRAAAIATTHRRIYHLSTEQSKTILSSPRLSMQVNPMTIFLGYVHT